MDTFRGRSTFKTWMLRLAINVSLNERGRRELPRADFAPAESITTLEVPEDELMRSEVAPEIHKALQFVGRADRTGALRGRVNRAGGLKTFVRFGVIFIAAVLAAAVLGIDVTILIVVTVIGLGAAARAAALALELGLRALSENVAASHRVSEGVAEGDEISLNGISGTIERIGHTMTTVRGPNGRVYLVPNSHFLTHVVEKQGLRRRRTKTASRRAPLTSRV